jgi:hypothetical protein
VRKGTGDVADGRVGGVVEGVSAKDADGSNDLRQARDDVLREEEDDGEL